MLLNYEEDESYTPQKVSIRTGFRADEMEEVNVIHLSQPQGWVRFPVMSGDQVGTTARAFVLQLGIIANHQSGRDTHVRQLKILASPRVSEIDGWEDQGVR
jgi:anaphase-promoting complex subunit 10